MRSTLYRHFDCLFNLFTFIHILSAVYAVSGYIR
jgi:hypothetical protein